MYNQYTIYEVPKQMDKRAVWENRFIALVTPGITGTKESMAAYAKELRKTERARLEKLGLKIVAVKNMEI